MIACVWLTILGFVFPIVLRGRKVRPSTLFSHLSLCLPLRPTGHHAEFLIDSAGDPVSSCSILPNPSPNSVPPLPPMGNVHTHAHLCCPNALLAPKTPGSACPRLGCTRGIGPSIVDMLTNTAQPHAPRCSLPHARLAWTKAAALRTRHRPLPSPRGWGTPCWEGGIAWAVPPGGHKEPSQQGKRGRGSLWGAQVSN